MFESFLTSLSGSGGGQKKVAHEDIDRTTEATTPPPPKVAKDNYKELGEKMVTDFIRAAKAEKEDGWQHMKAQDGVTIDRKSNDLPGGLDLLRGVANFNLPPEEVFGRLVDSSHLKYVDGYYELSKVCEVYDEEHSIVYYLYNFPWPMSKREFLCLEVYKKVDELTWLAISSSVDADHVATTESIVRGNLTVSGYQVKGVSGARRKCIVTTITQCDTGGLVPKWMVNKDATDQPLVLARLRNLFENNIKSFNGDK
jgi:hypothetical protein